MRDDIQKLENLSQHLQELLFDLNTLHSLKALQTTIRQDLFIGKMIESLEDKVEWAVKELATTNQRTLPPQ